MKTALCGLRPYYYATLRAPARADNRVLSVQAGQRALTQLCLLQIARW